MRRPSTPEEDGGDLNKREDRTESTENSFSGFQGGLAKRGVEVTADAEATAVLQEKMGEAFLISGFGIFGGEGLCSFRYPSRASGHIYDPSMEFGVGRIQERSTVVGRVFGEGYQLR